MLKLGIHGTDWAISKRAPWSEQTVDRPVWVSITSGATIVNEYLTIDELRSLAAQIDFVLEDVETPDDVVTEPF